MINKKGLMIAILVGSILVVALYPKMATSPNMTSPSEYDPWIDYNDDGKVDYMDLYSLAKAYGTSGDSTKNVNVVNWPSQYDVQYFNLNISWLENYGWQYAPVGPVFCGGYSRLSILMYPLKLSEGDYEVTILIDTIYWKDSTGIAVADSVDRLEARIYQTWSGWTWWVPEYAITETKAPYFQFLFRANSTTFRGWVELKVCVYLRNE